MSSTATLTHVAFISSFTTVLPNHFSPQFPSTLTISSSPPRPSTPPLPSLSTSTPPHSQVFLYTDRSFFPLYSYRPQAKSLYPITFHPSQSLHFLRPFKLSIPNTSQTTPLSPSIHILINYCPSPYSHILTSTPCTPPFSILSLPLLPVNRFSGWTTADGRPSERAPSPQRTRCRTGRE